MLSSEFKSIFFLALLLWHLQQELMPLRQAVSRWKQSTAWRWRYFQRENYPESRLYVTQAQKRGGSGSETPLLCCYWWRSGINKKNKLWTSTQQSHLETQKHLFTTVLIYFYYFFITKKVYFWQLTPVWILPNTYAIIRFTLSKLLCRYFTYSLDCFHTAIWLLQYVRIIIRRQESCEDKYCIMIKFFCTFLIQISLMSQLYNSREVAFNIQCPLLEYEIKNNDNSVSLLLTLGKWFMHALRGIQILRWL